MKILKKIYVKENSHVVKDISKKNTISGHKTFVKLTTQK